MPNAELRRAVLALPGRWCLHANFKQSYALNFRRIVSEKTWLFAASRRLRRRKTLRVLCVSFEKSDIRSDPVGILAPEPDQGWTGPDEYDNFVV